MSVSFTYSTPTPCSANDAVYATAWTPDLSGIPEPIVTVAVTINVEYTGTPDIVDRVNLYDGTSTDDGGHLDPVLDPGTGSIGQFELPIVTNLAPTVIVKTFRIAKPAPGDVIRIDVEASASGGAHVVTLNSISIVIDGETPSPCAPIELDADWETTATISATVEINEDLADFSAMTPTLQAVVAFDGSWHTVEPLLIGGGNVQLLIDGVVVADVPIVGARDVVNPYSVTFTGIANPGPGALLVVALLISVSHGEASSVTVDNVFVTITCEAVDSLVAPAPILAANTGESDTGQDIACVTDVGTSLSLARGPRNVGYALARRYVTPRGGLFYDPNYGTDMRAYLNAGFTPQALAQVQPDAASEASKDPRIENPVVVVTPNLATSEMKIAVTCDLAEGPYEFVFNVSGLTVELLKAQALA